MKAYVTSVGEPTTELCVWSLERNGFDVELILDDIGLSTLADKLKYIYEEAEEDFVRVDADIIVNQNFTPANIYEIEKMESLKDAWWLQFVTFDWYKQDLNHSLSYVKTEALEPLRNNIGHFLNHIRPETECSRIYEFYNPRRFETYDRQIMGIHGYGIKDLKPVRKLKANRGQSHLYDFELAERLNAL